MRDKAPKHTVFDLTLKGLEELDHFPTKESRARAFASLSGTIRGWELVKGVAVTASAPILTLVLLRAVLPRLWPSVFGVRFFHDFSVIFAILAFVVVLRWLHRRGAARWLRVKLVEEGVPVCVECGYLLRGLSPGAERCPECGRSLTAQVRCLIAGHVESETPPTSA